ncbi:MAG: hypothetical protein ACRCSU_11905 [Paracoccaceae bacterium]
MRTAWPAAIAAGFVGFVCASFVGAAVMMLCAQISRPDPAALGTIPVIALVVAILSLPGFLALRAVLLALDAKSYGAFGLAGAINALVISAWLASSSSHGWGQTDFIMMAAFGLSGIAAGIVYRKVERALLRQAEAVA